MARQSEGESDYLTNFVNHARACGIHEISVRAEPPAAAVEVIVAALTVLRSRRIPPPKSMLFDVVDDAETVAMYRELDDYLIINLRGGFWSEPVSQMRALAGSEYLVSDDPRAIVYHEVGHAAHRRRYRFGWYWWIASSRRLRGHRFETARLVSRYATVDTGEFVAEVFAGLLLGREFPDDVLRLYRDLRGPEV